MSLVIYVPVNRIHVLENVKLNSRLEEKLESIMYASIYIAKIQRREPRFDHSAGYLPRKQRLHVFISLFLKKIQTFLSPLHSE